MSAIGAKRTFRVGPCLVTSADCLGPCGFAKPPDKHGRPGRGRDMNGARAFGLWHYFENTTPCAIADPVQPCGHVRLSKSKPGLPFSSWKAVSTASAPLSGSKLSM